MKDSMTALTFAFDELEEPGHCPDAYSVLSTLACPPWCQLPPDHDADSDAGRVHRAEVFELDDRAYVSLAEVIFPGSAFGPISIEVEFWSRGIFTTAEASQIHRALAAAFQRRDEILDQLTRR